MGGRQHTAQWRSPQHDLLPIGVGQEKGEVRAATGYQFRAHGNLQCDALLAEPLHHSRERDIRGGAMGQISHEGSVTEHDFGINEKLTLISGSVSLAFEAARGGAALGLQR
jgi:hypothetical protein